MSLCIFFRIWTIYLILQCTNAFLPKPHGMPPPMGFIRVPNFHPSQMLPKNPMLLPLPFTPSPPTLPIPVQPVTSYAVTSTPLTSTPVMKLNDVILTTVKPRKSSQLVKNDIEEYVAEINAEKAHEKKLADILPLVTFDCHQRAEGYYADVAFNCDVFHYCGKPDGKRFTFFCPPGSRFNQIHMICDYAMFQGCEKSEDYFHLNDKIYPSNTNDTISHVVTSIPRQTTPYTTITIKPPTTTTTTTTHKPEYQMKPILKPIIKFNPKPPMSPKRGNRRWTSYPPLRRPVMAPLPFNANLQALGSHMPPPQMMLQPHLMPRINGKNNNKNQSPKIPPHIAAAIRQLTSRNFGNKNPHVPPRFVSDFTDGLHLSHFPQFEMESRKHNRYERPDFLHSREFRRRPFPPREFLEEFPEALARVDLNARRPQMRKPWKNWRSDEFSTENSEDDDEEDYVEPKDLDEGSVDNRRRYRERNKNENVRRHRYEKRNERVYKKTTTPAVESSEEVVVTTTTVAPRKVKSQHRKNYNKNVHRKVTTTSTITMEAIKAEKLTSRASYKVTSPRSVEKITSRSRPIVRKRVHNANISGRVNARKTTTTTTTSTTTTEKIPDVTTSATTTSTTEIVEKLEKSTMMARKLKHRKSKYHHSRVKTTTIPSTTSLPTSTSSTTSTTIVSTSTEPLKPTAQALISENGEESGVNEKSYV